ncbi:energy transducer TonB [Solimonas soli]|uniref:energy transducer TonB n=1 Tax=Solimonas soli TaxID=413479 RepID=UPI0004844789|nr:energy transducer TonB [Solimonas soli]
MQGIGPGGRHARARGCGLALTVLLHAAIIALLWLRAPPAHVERPAAAPALVMLALPSAIEQRAVAPAAARAPAPRPRRTPRRPAPSVAAAQAPVQVPPPPAETAALPSPAAGAAPQPAAAAPASAVPDTPPPIEYLRRISRLISLAQHYPWNARQYGHQGDVVVRMHLSRDGTVRSVTLIRSSGHDSLDAEARDVIWRIGRFPPFPFDYLPRVAEFDIDQPVTFRTYLN